MRMGPENAIVFFNRLDAGGLRVRRLGFAIDIKLGKETIEKGWGMKNRMFVQTPKASAFPL